MTLSTQVQFESAIWTWRLT